MYNLGEFNATIIKDFFKSKNIILINSRPYHPQSNGVVEAFNKYIINILENILLDEKGNFNIEKAILKAEDIYNKIVYSITKIESIKAIKFENKKDINILITNVLNSQKYINKNYNGIKKGEKCLLNDTFNLKGNILKI